MTTRKHPREWIPVVCAADCKPAEGDDDILICPKCHVDYAECACPGPHQEDIYYYKEKDGVLYAKHK